MSSCATRDKHNNGSEPDKRNSRPPSTALNTHLPSIGQQVASNTTAADQAPKMDTRSSSKHDKQADVQSLRPSSRSYDIGGPTPDIQTLSQDQGFAKPKRMNTNSSLKDPSAENGSLRQQVQEIPEKLTREQQSIVDQDAAYRTDAELSRLRAQVQEWQKKADAAQDDNDNLKEQLRRREREAQATIESLTLEHNRSKAENEAKIRLLVDGATRDKVDGRWNPPPDEDIRRRLFLLNTDMRDWAKTWATKNLVLDKAVSKETRNYFQDFVRFDPDNNFPLLFRKPSPKMKEKIARLLLHAALAHEIHDAFFDGKIFCLEPKDRDVVETLFRNLENADPKNAYIWRAGLWRLLNPHTLDETTKTPTILEATRNNVRIYCDSVSAAFRKKRANILFSVVAENSADAQNRAAKLRTILQQAAVIATSLWTQHSYFKTTDLTTIRNDRIVFDNTLPWLQAHPWSNVDEDSDQANGTEILLVARPCLLAFDADDTSGVDGDRYRVLVPAIVLLDGNY